MNARDALDGERLQLAFDQLATLSALDETEWPLTRSALGSIESVLAQVSLRPTEDENVQAQETIRASKGPPREEEDIPFPDAATDEVFAWYLMLQYTFHSNVATHLFRFLQRLCTYSRNETNAAQIGDFALTTADLLQGAVLLHRDSRSLFSRKPSMSVLVSFLDSTWPKEVESCVIQLLVCCCAETPQNLRTFESVGGFESVSGLFVSNETAVEVKYKVLEFLYFYLIPETQEEPAAATMQSSQTAIFHPLDAQRTVRASDSQGHTREPASDVQTRPSPTNTVLDSKINQSNITKTSEEKQQLLGRYFKNVDRLVEDLKLYKPFGDI